MAQAIMLKSGSGNESKLFNDVITRKVTKITAKDLEGVTKIPDFFFQECSLLESVEFPNGLNSIGASSFKYCKKIKDIIIPDSVTTVGGNAFDFCAGVKNIKIGRGVTKIGNAAFRHCSSLAKIIIPINVTTVGFGIAAFSGAVYCEATSVPSGWDSNWNSGNGSVYWYRSEQPTEEGNFWHYAEDGETPVIW